jgi:hypothetical protein
MIAVNVSVPAHPVSLFGKLYVGYFTNVTDGNDVRIRTG